MKQPRNRIAAMLENGSIRDLKEVERVRFLLRLLPAITCDPEYLPEYGVKKKARWSMSSRQGSRYIKARIGSNPALGNKDNEFLGAWKRNVENQNLIIINNSSLAQLLIKYAFNERQELEFEIEPTDLLRHDKSLPRNPVWLTRQINSISGDLVHAELLIDADVRNEHKRFVRFTKINKDGPTLSAGMKAYCN